MLSPEERDRLEAQLFPDGKFDTSLVGKSAETIAEAAEIKVPRGTRVLLVPLERIGDDYPLSREKLCPVLGFYEAATREAAMTACKSHGASSGRGALGGDPCKRPGDHPPLRRGDDCAPDRGQCRLLAGAAGFDTFLAPTMTIGTGYFGRSSVSENVGPQHLVQWTKVAYAKDTEFSAGASTALSIARTADAAAPARGRDRLFVQLGRRPSVSLRPARRATPARSSDDLKAEIRQLILEELRALQRERSGAR